MTRQGVGVGFATAIAVSVVLGLLAGGPTVVIAFYLVVSILFTAIVITVDTMYSRRRT